MVVVAAVGFIHIDVWLEQSTVLILMHLVVENWKLCYSHFFIAHPPSISLSRFLCVCEVCLLACKLRFVWVVWEWVFGFIGRDLSNHWHVNTQKTLCERTNTANKQTNKHKTATKRSIQCPMHTPLNTFSLLPFNFNPQFPLCSEMIWMQRKRTFAQNSMVWKREH